MFGAQRILPTVARGEPKSTLDSSQRRSKLDMGADA